MEFLVRFVQVHTSFRKPELEALAELHQVPLRILHYDDASPFCVVQLPDLQAARTLVARAILCRGIYELWGRGQNYEELHVVIQRDTRDQWVQYKDVSFKFSFDCYQSSRTTRQQREIVDSFGYVGFEGPILMSGADEEFTIFEEYAHKGSKPHALYLGRFVGPGGRDAVTKYSLKTRDYLSTTSMDAELTLISANLALAAAGKLAYDPFLGTGGLPLACAHFGAVALGSDIDPRTLRGKEGRNVTTNFGQYRLESRYLGAFIGDMTHSPFRHAADGWLDAIVCDPPYGVREGLRVLGRKDDKEKVMVVMRDGQPAHLLDGYVAPRQQYSFDALLSDILQFAASHLVPNGRLSFWMPTANDEAQELAIPTHPALKLVSACTQPFNKWSRRLLTYQLVPGASRETNLPATPAMQGKADDMNSFRKRYFQGFAKPSRAESADAAA